MQYFQWVSAVAAIALTCVTGCLPEDEASDRPLGNLGGGRADDFGGPGGPNGGGADDGSGGPGRPNGGGADDGGGGSAGALSPADAARVRDELRRALADRRLEFGRSDANTGSDAFITTDVQLVLCASGAFGRRTTVSFSSSAGGSQSESGSLGRWDIEVSSRGVFIVLDVERTNEEGVGRVDRLRFDVDDRGNGFVDGALIRSADPATEDCR